MKSKNEIITLQIGKFSNYVGSHLWNLRTDSLVNEDVDENSISTIDSSVYFHQHELKTYKPRCVMIDLNENVGSAFNSDPYADTVANSVWNGHVTKANQDLYTSNHGWSSVLKEVPHHKSVCSLPVWSNAQNFDSFYKGYVGREQSDGVTEAFLEEVLERIRYFAEACDYLSSVTCLADLQEGFGGLSSSIVDRIAQDYGRSMSVPVWGFVDTPIGTTDYSSNDSLDLSGKVSLQSLNVPLSYSRILEHAQLFIPIEANKSVSRLSGIASVDYRSASLVLALAIEASTGFQLPADRQLPVKAWISEATHMGRYPVCALESYLHDIKGLFGDGSADSVERDPETDVLSAFDNFNCFHSEDTRQYNHDKSGFKQRQLTNINPFTTSFSAVNSGAWAVETALDRGYQYVRPYTNSLNVQGEFSNGFNELLFEKCFNSPYLVSGVSRSAAPHFIDLGGVRQSKQATDHTDETEYFAVPSIGSVGCNGLTGRHVENVAAAWSNGTKVSSAQLEKVGMNLEERAELLEHILSISQLYST